MTDIKIKFKFEGHYLGSSYQPQTFGDRLEQYSREFTLENENKSRLKRLLKKFGLSSNCTLSQTMESNGYLQEYIQTSVEEIQNAQNPPRYIDMLLQRFEHYNHPQLEVYTDPQTFADALRLKHLPRLSFHYLGFKCTEEGFDPPLSIFNYAFRYKGKFTRRYQLLDWQGDVADVITQLATGAAYAKHKQFLTAERSKFPEIVADDIGEIPITKARKTINEFLGVLSGKNFKERKIMDSSLYAELIEYATSIAEEGVLPTVKKKTRKTGLNQQFLKRLFHELQMSLYNEKRRVWFEFLKAFFEDFSNWDIDKLWETSKTYSPLHEGGSFKDDFHDLKQLNSIQ